MKLLHLKDEVCPSCHARCVSEEQTQQHSNGEWFESRKFFCGCQIRHIPNFSRSEVVVECSRSEAVVQRNKQREEACDKLLSFTDQLDVDEKWKKHMLVQIRHYSTYNV